MSGPYMKLSAFPEDPVLPEVKIASDASRMLDVFRRHLRSVNGDTYHVQDCSLTRILYRETVRYLFQYNLRLVDSVTRRERIQWVSVVIYPEDRAERIWHELKTSVDQSPKISTEVQAFEPVSFVPEHKMLMQIFPFDRQLPALPLLLAGPSPELESLLLEQFGKGNWYPECCCVDPIHYRAEKAVVLRYTVKAGDKATGRREEKRFYAKIYRDERGEQVYQLLQALWGRSSTGEEHFTVGKPIAYLREHRALIQAEATGITFRQLLLDGSDNEANSAARKIARALAALHLENISPSRQYTAQDEAARLRRAGKILQWVCPDLKTEFEQIVSNIISGLKEVPLKPTHLDLKTDHILLDGTRYTLLDLDSFRLADPVLDVAHVLARLIAMQYRFLVPRARLGMAASAFCEEYFNHVPAAWRDRLKTHYSGALLKVAVGFFRRQEPKWPETVAALLAEASNSLAGRIWWWQEFQSRQGAAAL